MSPVALNPQRRRHLDPASTSPPPPARLFRSTPEVGAPEGDECRTKGGIYTKRPPMKCAGGVLFPSLPLCRRVHLTVGLFLTGGSEEFQLPAKLTPWCRRARLGPLVGLLGEHCVPSPSAVKHSGRNRDVPGGCARACVRSVVGRGPLSNFAAWVSLLFHSFHPFLVHAGLRERAADHRAFPKQKSFSF